jgi:hypothetical protein
MAELDPDGFIISHPTNSLSKIRLSNLRASDFAEGLVPFMALIQIHPLYTFIPDFFKIYFNIILLNHHIFLGFITLKEFGKDW